MPQSRTVKAAHLPGSGASRTRRFAPIALAALVAFAVGTVAGARHVAPAERLAERYAAAWSHGDYTRLYDLTDSPGGNRSRDQFVAAHRDAAATATLVGIRFGAPHAPRDGAVEVPAVARTRAFGTVRAVLALPIGGDGDAARVRWAPHLAFPGLRPGEQLERRTELPPRAALLARDNTRLETSAPSILGEMGPATAARAAELRAAGVPDGAQVGISGLQRVFDAELRGRPGGELTSGGRLLGRGVPRAGRDVRTTISPGVQTAAVTAIAGRLGGIVALRPTTGEVIAAAGIGFSGLQPPGSTFKIITLTGALEDGLTKPSTAYPVETAALLEGVRLENANGESCGGTLLNSFAHSCNSVFAPLGVKLGADRLVETARRFGFDEDPRIPGAATSTLPDSAEIGDALALGSSAIGQGRVQATALQMAVVAAAIGLEGRRPLPTLRLGERRGAKRVTTPRIARTVRRLMEAVVAFGTGTAAAVPGTRVAGKTGTAELEDTRVTVPGEPPPPPDPENTDAWFASFAPSRKPRVAVGVLLVRSGAGGATAAPAARAVMEAALKG